MASTRIASVKARKIMDSRGNWTIEVDVITVSGMGRCAAPSGASTGKYEVRAFPEGGVDKALSIVERRVAPKLVGMDSAEQEAIDGTLSEVDGTNDFSSIGGNSAVAISLANAKAAANSKGKPLFRYLGKGLKPALPRPLGNAVGGGKHAANGPDIQEFLLLPEGADDLREAMELNIAVYRKAGEKLLKLTKGSFGRGDEGAWAPDLDDETVLDVLRDACEEATDEEGGKIRMGLDVAASSLWDPKARRYVYKKERVKRTREEHMEHILSLVDEYGIYYLEDPLEENDFDGFAELTKETKCLVCGDDLYATNSERIKIGAKKRSSRAVLIKPNQCGTLTDTYKAISLAKKERMVPVMSHRSGETADDTIAHMAVAFGCPILKAGIAGGERTAKLNELIRIGEELEEKIAMAPLPEL